MESDVSYAIVGTLQQLKIGTYDSIRECDPRYSLDTYKTGIRSMESRGQVKRMVFPVGKSERFIWLLPWYDEDALGKLMELREEVLDYLSTTPSTGRQIRDYFKTKLPTYHQITYLVLREMARKDEVRQITFNDGHWVTIYYLPEKKEVLDGLAIQALGYVNTNGSAFSRDLSEALKIPKSLASALLAQLAYENKLSRIKIGWSYLRNMPIFAYCKEGHEAEAVARYHKLAQKRMVESRRSKLVSEYMAKFRGACDKMRVNESLADLAGSYFNQVVRSAWLRGRSGSIAAWACFFLAGRILKQGITIKEIWTYGKVPQKLVLATTKELNDFLQLSVPDLYPRAGDYVSRIVMKLPMSSKLFQSGRSRQSELIEAAKHVIESMPREVSFGRKAQGVAAGAVDLAAEGVGISELTQKKVAKAANITDVGLRNILKSAEGVIPGKEEHHDHRKRPSNLPADRAIADNGSQPNNVMQAMR